MEIGEKLQFLRKLKGFTQKEIALMLNMERRSYANLENNTTKIDISRMNQIARIYGIEVEEILNFELIKPLTNVSIRMLKIFFRWKN